MADQPEVIQHELEETRHALAEKLGQIGEKISGTVENVTDTVENVSEMVGNVSSMVENTVESVTDTMESMGETAQDTVDAVKEAFNVPEQMRRHPWLWFGGSVLLGFIGGKAVGGFPGPRARKRVSRAHGNGYAARAAEEHFGEPSAGARGDRAATAEKSPSWISKLTEQFGPQLNQLKSLALGTLFGVTRDMITQSLPQSLKSQMVNVFNDITEAAGGKPIPGEVFPDQEKNESEQDSPHEKGDEHEGRNPTEMDRPLGAAERQGKSGVGKSHR
jgi:hypothetical protein